MSVSELQRGAKSLRARRRVAPIERGKISERYFCPEVNLSAGMGMSDADLLLYPFGHNFTGRLVWIEGDAQLYLIA